MAWITDRTSRRPRTGGKGAARSRGAGLGTPACWVGPGSAGTVVGQPAVPVVPGVPAAGTVAAEPAAAQSAGAPVGPPGAVVGGSGTIPPVSLTVTGVLVVLLGAWAGISVFVGPVFGYDPDGPLAWTWTRAHALLYLAPGVAGVLAGLMLVSGAGLAAHGYGRGVTRVAGSLAALAGGWLIIGPIAWPLLSTPGGLWGGAAGTTLFLRQIGANFGVGALLLAFGAYAFGLAGQARRVVQARLA